MIKGISSINGMVKTASLAAILAGSTALYASKPIHKADKEANKTELVSKSGAEALKSMSLQNVQQNYVPSKHNTRIDNDLRKYAVDDMDRTFFNGMLEQAYSNFGTYLASVFMQHEVDFQHFYLFMSGNTELLEKNNIAPSLAKKIKSFGPDFFKTVTPNEPAVTKWAQEEYTPTLVNLMQFDHKPNWGEVDLKLNSIVDEKLGLKLEDKVKFYENYNEFCEKKLNNRVDDMAKSERLAYKMYLIDNIIFEKSIYNSGVFGPGRFSNGNLTLRDYYHEWMNTISPKINNK